MTMGKAEKSKKALVKEEKVSVSDPADPAVLKKKEEKKENKKALVKEEKLSVSEPTDSALLKKENKKKKKKNVAENKENSSSTVSVEPVKPRVPKDLNFVKKPKIGEKFFYLRGKIPPPPPNRDIFHNVLGLLICLRGIYHYLVQILQI